MATHKDIARCMQRAYEIRESSYTPANQTQFGVGEYGKGWEQAAEEACAELPEITELVSTICACGYSEFWDWADKNKD